MLTFLEYQRMEDVSCEHCELVENASGLPLSELDLNDVNSFIENLIIFHQEAEDEFWKK